MQHHGRMLLLTATLCARICGHLGYDYVVPPENERCLCADAVNKQTPDEIKFNAKWYVPHAIAPYEPIEDDRTPVEYDESDL